MRVIAAFAVGIAMIGQALAHDPGSPSNADAGLSPKVFGLLGN